MKTIEVNNIQYNLKEECDNNELNKLYLQLNNIKISPWTDISYRSNESCYHFVNEIPKGTIKKMEMNKTIQYNPIMQDIKDGKPRVFSYGNIPFNYGFIPQTWENPNILDKYTNMPGDDDPIDVIEISDMQIGIGEIQNIKILGIITMIDDNETDWKVLAVTDKNPNFDKINTIKNIDNNKMNIIIDWLKNYKSTNGISKTYVGDILDCDMAHEIIEETHDAWFRRHNLPI
jgi:inorganic pyrophosphatase